MIAILGGLGAATVFATATLCSSRSTRMIGAGPVLSWVMMLGFVIVVPWAVAEGVPEGLDTRSAGWLVVAGLGNVLGLLLASATREAQSTARKTVDWIVALYAVGAAVSFGFSLYATARVSAELPIVWALLPARVVGVLLVALPLALTARLRLTRRALPLVVASGIAEVLGFALFAIGSRHGIAVSAVLASQFGAIAGVA